MDGDGDVEMKTAHEHFPSLERHDTKSSRRIGPPNRRTSRGQRNRTLSIMISDVVGRGGAFYPREWEPKCEQAGASTRHGWESQ